MVVIRRYGRRLHEWDTWKNLTHTHTQTCGIGTHTLETLVCNVHTHTLETLVCNVYKLARHYWNVGPSR